MSAVSAGDLRLSLVDLALHFIDLRREPILQRHTFAIFPSAQAGGGEMRMVEETRMVGEMRMGEMRMGRMRMGEG